MYVVDELDEVVELGDVPQSSVGAPLPVVMASERAALLAFLAERAEPGGGGTSVRVVDQDSPEPVVVVSFEEPYALMFGPPNDEAFSGHPLSGRGLHPYGVFRVDRSSWLRSLERMNVVHERHRPEQFERLSHFVFAFHDSTFECVASAFQAELRDGPLSVVVEQMAALLGG